MYFGEFFGPNHPNNVFQEVPPIALIVGVERRGIDKGRFWPLIEVLNPFFSTSESVRTNKSLTNKT